MKKENKISLGTAICLAIIFILIIVIIGMFYYFNTKKSEVKENTETSLNSGSTVENAIPSNQENEMNNTLNYSVDNKIYSLKKDDFEFKIEFLNNKFISYDNQFTVIGEYKKINSNKIRCDIKSYSWLDNRRRTFWRHVIKK